MNKKLIIPVFILLILFKLESIEQDNKKIAFINCTIIDGTGNDLITNAILLISNGKIEEIAQEISIPDGYNIIDLTGKILLPGFINTHVHDAYNEKNLQEWLKAGVTTVRDLGANPNGSYLSLRKKLMTNPLNARIISATPVICPENGYGFYFINSPEDVIKAINNFIDMRVDIIKISIEDKLDNKRFKMFTQDEIKSITDTAHSRGFRVTAHITHTKNLDLAIGGGVDELAHMVIEPVSKKQIEKIAKMGIYWIPTLELWNKIQNLYPVEHRSIAVDNLNKFYKAGGNIALGTDSNGMTSSFDRGFPVTEVRLMKSAGMSIMDIITAGTKNAAIVCGRKDLGTLEKGKIADILVLNKNPLNNIKAFLDPFMIIKEGIIVIKYTDIKKKIKKRVKK